MLRARVNGQIAPADGLASLADAELVERVRAGHETAFEPIMRRYNRRLFRAARGIVGNDAEAEDVVQEAYVRAYYRLDQFRGPHGLGAWLTRIAVNEALMQRRRPQSGAAADLLPLDDDAFEDAAMNDGRYAPPTPEETTASEQLRGLLEGCIDRLPPAYRAAFLLREIEGLSVAETAASLGIAKATVKTRVHRARRTLRRTLSRDLRGALGAAYPFDGHRCDRTVAAVFRRLSEAPGASPGGDYH